jgi:energy-coupling factor transporter ATP-binding protein EcfA2
LKKRSEVPPAKTPAREAPRKSIDEMREAVVLHDTNNEMVIVAAAIADVEAREMLTRRLSPDHFRHDLNKAVWTAMRDLVLRKLDYDHATMRELTGDENVVRYLVKLEELRPDLPANLEFHVRALLWDAKRAAAVEGPIASLLEAIQNQREEPERVRALARAVGDSFDNVGTNYILESKELVRVQLIEMDKRIAGRASYPFGIEGFDDYEADEGELPRKRILAGAAPGLVTVVTGVPGSGKSTFIYNMASALRRNKRRVLMGAWEVQAGPSLEIMAAIELGLSRSRVIEGKLEPEERVALEDRMHLISRTVKFMANPFRRGKSGGKKVTNDTNLDVVQENISDSGCDVVILDLWKRCIRDTRPDEEEDALMRQQAMLEEMRVHGVLVQQLRSKDVEQRPDKRPTREAIKGSGAWTEVPDLIVGIHRPALWKSKIDDDKIEAIILKQRYGEWPLAIEFDWKGETGFIGGGRAIPYEQPGEGSELDAFIPAPQMGKKRAKGGRRG